VDLLESAAGARHRLTDRETSQSPLLLVGRPDVESVDLPAENLKIGHVPRLSFGALTEHLNAAGCEFWTAHRSEPKPTTRPGLNEGQTVSQFGYPTLFSSTG